VLEGIENIKRSRLGFQVRKDKDDEIGLGVDDGLLAAPDTRRWKEDRSATGSVVCKSRSAMWFFDRYRFFNSGLYHIVGKIFC
jgi:hypothetical protein